jgi:hypothetical protein
MIHGTEAAHLSPTGTSVQLEVTTAAEYPYCCFRGTPLAETHGSAPDHLAAADGLRITAVEESTTAESRAGHSQRTLARWDIVVLPLPTMLLANYQRTAPSTIDDVVDYLS